MELFDWSSEDEETTTSYAIILTDASQWHLWFSLVKSDAQGAEIWDLMDPSLEQEPPHTRPPLPRWADIPGTGQLRSDRYTDAMARFRRDDRKYERERKALRQTLAAIQISISEEYLMYILAKSSPWKALRALQEAIEPSYRMLTVLRR